MLKDIIDGWGNLCDKIEARGIIGFYPCNSDENDDIEVYDENDGKTVKAKFATLR